MAKKRKRGSKWARQQPNDGDSLLMCGHIEKCPSWHWYKTNMEVKRPDKTTLVIDWLVACNDCVRKAKGDVMRIPFRQEATWMGDEPVIRSSN